MHKKIVKSILLILSLAFAVNTYAVNTVTADMQAYGSKHDLEITSQIRKKLVANKELSTAAQNVKIITLSGRVYLRGQVQSAAEKLTVAAYAKKIAGEQNVNDDLSIALK